MIFIDRYQDFAKRVALALNLQVGRAMRVLVVEDDRSVRETLGIVLETYRIESELVPNGERALDSLRARWPDVMLLDLTLEEMSGEELYDRIRHEFGVVPPTVVLSAAQQGANRARHMPGTRFLAKPYTLEQLIQILIETAQVKPPVSAA